MKASRPIPSRLLRPCCPHLCRFLGVELAPRLETCAGCCHEQPHLVGSECLPNPAGIVNGGGDDGDGGTNERFNHGLTTSDKGRTQPVGALQRYSAGGLWLLLLARHDMGRRTDSRRHVRYLAIQHGIAGQDKELVFTLMPAAP